MVTEVIMKRDLFGMSISQKSKSEFFSATDLVAAANKWRAINDIQPFSLSAYMKLQSTKDFMFELEEKYGKCKINSKGKGQHTWVHPFLFIDIALTISPKLKIETYEWLFDSLIKNRNSSGDSYKKMAGALYALENRKCDFSKNIVKVAGCIQKACGVSDWQDATEDQLKKRDRIHENICIISDFVKDSDECVRLSIVKAGSM